MSYVFYLEDLAGNALSELPGAKAKRFSSPIGSMGTSGLGVPAWHDDADFLLEGDALLKVVEYDDDFLRDDTGIIHAHHRLVTAEEVAQAGQPPTVAATFADPFWVLMRRVIGKAIGGYVAGSAAAMVDRGTIITDVVNTTNAEDPSGVRMGTVAASSSTYIPAGSWVYKVAGTAIAELGATLDGPDWRIRPIDYVPVAGKANGYIGELDVAPVIGGREEDVVFEFGDGLLNASGYRRAVSLEGTRNRLHHLPPGYPTNATLGPLIASDAPSIATRGLLEDVLSAGTDLTVDDLRLKLLAHHIAVRAGARQLITFTPVRQAAGSDRVPRFGRDYSTGDIVSFRASLEHPGDPGDGPELVKRIDVLTRIYNADVAVDELGNGTVTLTTTPT